MPPKKAAAAAPAAPAEPPPPLDPLVLFGPDISLVRPRVAAAFRVFDPEGTGAVLAEDCLPLLRSLRVYCSEREFADSILPELLGGAPAGAPAVPAVPVSAAATASTHVLYSNFERKAVELIEARAFEPEPADVLLSAFRALDKANTGLLDAEKFKELLMGTAYGAASPAHPMTEAEWELFVKVLPVTLVVDEATEKTRTMIAYEGYVRLASH